MKQHNYKAGDKVRIIGNSNPFKLDGSVNHGFTIGEVVTVRYVFLDGDLRCDSAEKSQIVSPQHVELVEADKPAIFNPDDIKAGYLLEVKVDSKGDAPFYVTVIPYACDANALGCCCPGKYWAPLSHFYVTDNIKILRVYGHTSNMRLLDNSPDGRELLWERPEEPKAVEMTVAEISEKLGYEVKIVKEKTN